MSADPYAGWWRVYFAGEEEALFKTEALARAYVDDTYCSWANVEVKQR